MDNVITLHLQRRNMSAPVQLNVGLDGVPTGQPGVTAIISIHEGLGWCILADHPQNPGASVTNSALPYASAVCLMQGCDMGDLAWFELDSEGHFDELQLLGGAAGFAPLLEHGTPPRSREAFAARVGRLAAGFPAEAVTAIEACLARFGAQSR